MEKLVRDHVPAIIRGDGGSPDVRVASAEEMPRLLAQKLFEEAEELAQSLSLEELADVYEVVLAAAEELGFGRDALEAARAEKHARVGGFSRRIVLTLPDEPRGGGAA